MAGERHWGNYVRLLQNQLERLRSEEAHRNRTLRLDQVFTFTCWPSTSFLTPCRTPSAQSTPVIDWRLLLNLCQGKFST